MVGGLEEKRKEKKRGDALFCFLSQSTNNLASLFGCAMTEAGFVQVLSQQRQCIKFSVDHFSLPDINLAGFKALIFFLLLLERGSLLHIHPPMVIWC